MLYYDLKLCRVGIKATLHGLRFDLDFERLFSKANLILPRCCASPSKEFHVNSSVGFQASGESSYSD